jgi:hypothetical protein
MNGSNNLILDVRDDSGTIATAKSSSAISTNSWFYVVALRDGNNIKIYLNGVEEGIASALFGTISNANKARIGTQAHFETQNPFNGTIDSVRIYNRSLTSAEINLSYHSQLYKYSQNKYSFYVNQSSLIDGAEYTYSVSVSDLAGNVNQTETRTITGDTEPGFISITSTPSNNSLDDLDPNTTIVIEVNISDNEQNIDTVILQWKNASSNWNENNVTNVTMINQTAKSTYTIFNGSFRPPYSVENNYTYRIWANTTQGRTNTSQEYNLTLYWDCTWNAAPLSLGATAGYGERKSIGNITINNTGDSEYSNDSCSLDFTLKDNFPSIPTRVSLNGINNDLTFTLSAKENKTIQVNFTFYSHQYQQQNQ